MYPPPVAEGGWSEFIKDFGIGSGGALKLGPASQLTKSKPAGYRWLVSAGILVLVEQGLRKGDIAERLGCEESTLVTMFHCGHQPARAETIGTPRRRSVDVEPAKLSRA